MKRDAERFMTVSEAVPPALLLVPLPRGYGARLEYLDPHAARYDAAAIADGVRREADVLAPDLMVMGCDPTILAEACGCRIDMPEPYKWDIKESAVKGGPDSWAFWQPPDVSEASPFAELIQAMDRVRPVISCPVTCMLPAPFTLARLVGGSAFERAFETGDTRWQDLVDVAVMVVSDAIKMALRRGSCGIVLYEDGLILSGKAGNDLVRLYGTCFNVLRHHERRCLYVIADAKEGMGTTPVFDSFLDVIASVVVCINAASLPEAAQKMRGPTFGWAIDPVFFTFDDAAFAEAMTVLAANIQVTGVRVFMPIVPAAATPERVRELVVRFRSAVDADFRP
ncbi:MAG: uroporphyrinogen decarboxylase family protein [Alicyclobacillaceae bacterium]|nr:uroporphyrinogen decarboxylase family protein [Alicyclobacillaceae bacterium]